MNENRVAGTTRNLGGKAQEGYGRVAGDTKSEVEGVMNQAVGAAQDLYGQVQDSAMDAAQAVKKGAMKAEDRIRDFIEKRPYTAAFTALCIGWAIAHFRRRD
jgi:uncharacterized protein YjbJ (UPF0337 family)